MELARLATTSLVSHLTETASRDALERGLGLQRSPRGVVVPGDATCSCEHVGSVQQDLSPIYEQTQEDESTDEEEEEEGGGRRKPPPPAADGGQEEFKESGLPKQAGEVARRHVLVLAASGRRGCVSDQVGGGCSVVAQTSLVLRAPRPGCSHRLCPA